MEQLFAETCFLLRVSGRMSRLLHRAVARILKGRWLYQMHPVDRGLVILVVGHVSLVLEVTPPQLNVRLRVPGYDVPRVNKAGEIPDNTEQNIEPRVTQAKPTAKPDGKRWEDDANCNK